MLPSIKELLAFGSHVRTSPGPAVLPLGADSAAARQRPGRKAGSSDRYSAASDARQYRCGVHSCAALFKRPEHLKRHMLTHTQARPFCCDIQGCGKRFSRRDNYATHTRKHDSEQSGALDGSPGSSPAASSRRSTPQDDAAADPPSSPAAKRSRQDPPKLHPLDLLAYASVHAPSLEISPPPAPSAPPASAGASSPQPSPGAPSTDAAGAGPPADPAKPFACSMCDSRFGRMEHVKRHQLVHTGERQYECPVCSKPFARKDNMVQHQRAHQRPAGDAATVVA
ncbi:hypothetical protein IWQ56_002282 [Coemansia nantahalensis]|nr:hypothetical protein IWQ56_002282 [Coemansia nantahalensis]